MYVLGVESSCDETAAAVVASGPRLVSNEIASQVTTHALYGGVVPEVASREHALRIVEVAERAAAPIGGLKRIDAVAVTAGPGLVGALLVGLQFAKGLAFGRRIPFVGVNHLEGHLAAALLDEAPPPYPHVALLVSGGHTQLYHVARFGAYRLLGTTRDDAAGEAFDKVAKVMGLGYPGGVAIEKQSQTGNPKAYALPRARLGNSYDFSFSGLKTAASQAFLAIEENARTSTQVVADFSASFQQAVVDVLVDKTLRAARDLDVKTVVLGGGVAANALLRAQLTQQAAEEKRTVYLPPRHLCTDNAAMIAAAGLVRLEAGEASPWSLAARSRWPLAQLTKPCPNGAFA